MINYYAPQLEISLSGCGFMGKSQQDVYLFSNLQAAIYPDLLEYLQIERSSQPGAYHIGALILLQQIWPQKFFNKITGASCGGWVSMRLDTNHTNHLLEMHIHLTC